MDVGPPSWLMKGLILSLNFARKIGLKRFVARVRNRAVRGIVTKLHSGIHEVRRFAVSHDKLVFDHITLDLLRELANKSRNIVADLLEIRPQEVHCTIKVCRGPGNPTAEWTVYTIARSEPCARKMLGGMINPYKLGNDSAFAALCGISDGRTEWTYDKRQCFMCNDLVNHGRFVCNRADWSSHFRAAAVFPLRYTKPDDMEPTVVGFLTFDTMRAEACSDWPCVYDLLEDKGKYDRNLLDLSVFHVGGMLADAIACAFRPLLEPINTGDNGNE